MYAFHFVNTIDAIITCFLQELIVKVILKFVLFPPFSPFDHIQLSLQPCILLYINVPFKPILLSNGLQHLIQTLSPWSPGFADE